MNSEPKSRDIKCPNCPKKLARYENGKIFVWCRQCRKEVELIVKPEPANEPTEPTKKG